VGRRLRCFSSLAEKTKFSKAWQGGGVGQLCFSFFCVDPGKFRQKKRHSFFFFNKRGGARGGVPIKFF